MNEYSFLVPLSLPPHLFSSSFHFIPIYFMKMNDKEMGKKTVILVKNYARVVRRPGF